MRNPIISSTLVVFGFWWAVAFVWGAKEFGFPQDLMYLTVATKAAILGAGTFLIAAFAMWGKRWIDQGGLMETHARGAQCSIGVLPGLVRWARSKKSTTVNAKRWPRTARWQKEAPEEYAKAFQAILDTLGAQPKLPASPVAGGHGGQTLLDHSLNVVETGLELMDRWTFARRPNDPLAGSSVSTDDRDVMVLILAGHDLGKLEAFRMEGGKVVEWKRSHDREGARILATMEETWAIPEDDRKTLIAVVSHEHHPQDLPMHTGDRTRLLLEFLIDSDAEASRREEGKTDLSGAEETAQGRMNKSSAASSQAAFGDDESIWLWFIDFLAKPGTINGRDKRFRVGFKGADGRIFLNEVSIRRALAEEFYKDPLMAENRKGDGRYVITENLMRVLGERNVLLQVWDGQRYSHKNALFRVISRNKEGKVVGQWAAAIIVDLGESMPASLRAMAPAPNPPEIVEAVFSQRALKDADGAGQGTEGSAEEQAHPETEEVTDVWHEEGGAPVETTPKESLALKSIEAESWDEPLDAGHPVTVSSENEASSHVAQAASARLAEAQPVETDFTSFDYGAQALVASEFTSKTRDKSGKGRRPRPPKTDRAKALHAALPSGADGKESIAPPESMDFMGASGRTSTLSLHCKHGCGVLAKAILRGMEKRGRNSKKEQAGSFFLSPKEVVELSSLGALPVVDLDAFLAAVGDNPRVLGGLTFIRDGEGRVEQVIIHLGDSENQE